MKSLKSLYFSLADTNPRVHRALYPWVIFARSFVVDLKAFPRQLLQVDIIRFFVALPRYLIGFLLLRRFRTFDGGIGISPNTLAHNIRGSGELSAPRSHLLIRPIVTLDRVAKHIRDLKVLTIGPRVEGEIYNLMAYGFRSENIRGLDLFSYSPSVDVGDMHDMPYPDNSFDVVISGWVLGYSDEKERCAAEMMRVCKPGGTIAIGNAYSSMTEEEITRHVGSVIGASEPINNLEMVEHLFEVSPGDIYFKYDGSLDGVNGAPIILIFRLAKSSNGEG